MTTALDSVEGFARLCARLEDDFSPRAAVLSSAGLDDVSWARIEARWLAELAGNETSLAARFAAVYGEARLLRATPRPGETLESRESGSPGSSTPAWREEARALPLLALGEAPLLKPSPSREDRVASSPLPIAVPPFADVDRTVELPLGQVGPALPFRPASPGNDQGPRGSSCVAHPSISSALLAVTGAANDDAFDRTTLCLLDASPGAPLPFRPAPSAAPPLKRLHRFDPQTGLPLPAPVWVDLPATSTPKP